MPFPEEILKRNVSFILWIKQRGAQTLNIKVSPDEAASEEV